MSKINILFILFILFSFPILSAIHEENHSDNELVTLSDESIRIITTILLIATFVILISLIVFYWEQILIFLGFRRRVRPVEPYGINDTDYIDEDTERLYHGKEVYY